MEPKVYVVLWFDTEDFVTPESDDAAKRLAELLSLNGVRGTFKLVGEKVRALERRGRYDVISAIKQHDVGYHTDRHSVHPVVAEYLKDPEMERGKEEFLKREGRGIDDIKRVFGVSPSCYGQPGDSWAPQVYLALRDLGITVYLDESNFIDLDGGPFWYCGILNVLKLSGAKGRIIGLPFEMGQEGFLDQLEKEFDAAYEEVVRAGGPGIISIYNHPTTLVTEEFWDAVNFARGRNTPLDQLKLPRLKSPQQVEAGFKDFDSFLKYVKSKPGVEFVTASDLKRIFADAASDRDFSRDELAALLNPPELISYREVGGIWVSAAEIFWMVVQALSSVLETGALPSSVKNKYPLGPYGEVRSEAFPYVTRREFLSACLTAREFIEANGRLPDFVELKGVKISPEDFLSTAALVYLEESSGKRAELVKVVEGTVASKACVRYLGAKSAWNWVIFPDHFEAWNLVELARLQAWTAKPATASLREGVARDTQDWSLQNKQGSLALQSGSPVTRNRIECPAMVVADTWRQLFTLAGLAPFSFKSVNRR